ncbi:MAG: hypothetical protein RML15_08290 [Bacteroidota bacterium]|nr:hypothetical protein [Candidatus Kapabacteria bacterium]MCS7302726.1 hypothetical protein [Candidatus Kapabacteria bacterium]MCX7937057.1 hypothetical protein [Chlorobiota bacterium]MDW8075156.1 hypothetical protein [Bacteroidota bacterium]MDW8272387.1 hypothetical protein [Bacteroidota bacterium]
MRWLPCSVAIVLVLVFSGCDGGLDPTALPPEAIISGRLLVRGGKETYPPPDSLRDLRVVAFRTIPRDSSVIAAVLSGQAYFTQTPVIDSTHYTITIPFGENTPEPLRLEYIAVAQLYGPNLFGDWRVVGVYATDTLWTPRALTVSRGERRTDIDITIDFRNPPPQPFR